MRLHACLVLAAGLFVAADAPKGDAKKDLDKLQGTWVGVSAEHNGEKRPEDGVKKMKFIVKGEKWTINIDGEDRIGGTLKLNPTKKPKELDSTLESGETVQAIYDLKGDEFKLCYANPGGDRPKEFVTKPDSETNLIVYKRDKK